MILSILSTRFPASTFLALCGISSALVVSIAGATALTANTAWFGDFFGSASSPPTVTMPATTTATQNEATATSGTPDAMPPPLLSDVSPLSGFPTATIPTFQPQGEAAVPALPGAAAGFGINLPPQLGAPAGPNADTTVTTFTDPSLPSGPAPDPASVPIPDQPTNSDAGWWLARWRRQNVPAPPLPPAPPRSCYVCQYEPLPDCDDKERGDPCNDTVTRRNRQKECVWAGERCVGRFQAYCESKIAASTSDWKIPMTGFPTAATYPSTCTTRNYEFKGHSSLSACRTFFQNISLCVEGAKSPDGTPVSFNFVNNGCSTFGNVAAVYREIARIRDALPPGVSLTVTGNQVPAGHELPNIDGDQTLGDAVCQTHWTLQIQRDAPVREVFGACTPGAFCYEGSARCSLNGVDSRQTCCTDPYAVDPADNATWTMGATCPVPNCRTDQSCSTPGRSVSCNLRGTTTDQVCCITDPFAASAAGPDAPTSWTYGNRCTVPDCRTNQPCGRLSMPVSCKENNQVTRQQCCVNASGEGVWTGGPVCNTNFYGTCTGTSTSFFSSDANAPALRDAYICLGARAARCQSFSYPEPCSRTVTSDGIFSRIVRYVCPYICTPRLPNL